MQMQKSLIGLNKNVMTDAKSEDENNFECRYGWGRFRPDCLQCVNTPRWMVTFSALLLLFSSLSTISVCPSTIERRFHFSSTDIATTYIPGNIAGFVALLVVSHYSEKGNKVRWVTYTSLLAISCNLVVFSARYISPRADLNLISSSGDIQQTSAFCKQGRNQDECELGKEASHGSRIAWYLFCLSSIMYSVSVASHSSTMLSYIDENVSRESSMVYTAIMLAINGASLALSVGIVGYFLTWNEDFDRVDPSKLPPLGDANFIGAWWVPPVFAALSTALFLIPYSGYPRRMPRGKAQQYRNLKIHPGGDLVQVDHARTTGLILSLKVVLSVPTFIYGTIRQALDTLLIAGFIVFLPKFLESQYGFPTETAVILPGVIGVLPGCIGTILGGLIASKLQLKLRGIYVMAFMTTLISFTLSFPFLLPCPSTKFAGVTVPYAMPHEKQDILPQSKRNLTISHSCNLECGCPSGVYDPHCSSQNVTYYSSCFAGCEEGLSTCTCLKPQTYDGNRMPTLTRGKCDPSCPWRPFLFCFMTAIGTLIGSSAAYLIVQSNLMNMPFHSRTLALGLQSVMNDIFGALPGTTVLGRIFDGNCILWKEICSHRASCILYDTRRLAYSISVYGAAVRIGQLIALFMAIRSISPKGPNYLKKCFTKVFGRLSHMKHDRNEDKICVT